MAVLSKDFYSELIKYNVYIRQTPLYGPLLRSGCFNECCDYLLSDGCFNERFTEEYFLRGISGSPSWKNAFQWQATPQELRAEKFGRVGMSYYGKEAGKWVCTMANSGYGPGYGYGIVNDLDMASL